MADQWRVIIKLEVECLRGDLGKGAIQVVSKQDSTWGAIAGTPGEAFEQACGEGFISYSEALPKVVKVSGEIIQ